MTATLKLDIEDAKELRFDAPDGFEEIEREHLGERRWVSMHRVVFREDAIKLWEWT